MNTTSEDMLKVNLAAQEDNINSLYMVIQENPHVLEGIDSIPFVETPLHVAASLGHHQFATEIMRLKPSFGWKLNTQGFTPIHLALQRNHMRMVCRFVNINQDLVRAKGKKGRTPLHLASKKGEIDLLTLFLWACPYSIEDVTVRNETTLHFAVRHGQYEALQVLVRWLMRTSEIDAEMERRILNYKDEQGNTILHVSSCQNNLQMVQLLVKTTLDLRVKNFEGRTALDLAPNEEIRNILVRAMANSPVIDVPTLANMLKSKVTMMDRLVTIVRRTLRAITEEQRNAYLIIATLIITATYQSALSPPGGVYQANAGDNNAINATNSLNSTITILNSTATTTQRNHAAGKSVMPGDSFIPVSFTNFLCFVVSAVTIFFLIPGGIVGFILGLLVVFLTGSYIFSMVTISPTFVMPFVYSIFTAIVSCLMLTLVAYYIAKSRRNGNITWKM